ncbi:MAG: transposase [Kiritimatiellae bacterium]|nr:transposase [Kiritimatiellia bacterium]
MSAGDASKGNGVSNPLNHGQECPCPGEDASFYNKGAETDTHRRNLPHWQQGHVWCFVTWRLGDSLPKAKLEQWTSERAVWMSRHPEPWGEDTDTEYHDRFSRQIDEWLDQGSGSCVLRDSANAALVAEALRHFDGERYEIASFVVMPNHVHVLFRPLGEHALAEILKSWKGFTAREINKRMGKTGALWQEEYWDRLIRNERHFFKVAEYIRMNPVKAKLKEGEFVVWERGSSSPLDHGLNRGTEMSPLLWAAGGRQGQP